MLDFVKHTLIKASQIPIELIAPSQKVIVMLLSLTCKYLSSMAKSKHIIYFQTYSDKYVSGLCNHTKMLFRNLKHPGCLDGWKFAFPQGLAGSSQRHLRSQEELVYTLRHMETLARQRAAKLAGVAVGDAASVPGGASSSVIQGYRSWPVILIF